MMWGEAPTPWMREMAADVLNLLDTAYPGHPWKVQVYGDETGGGFHIRHLEFDGQPYGMNQPRAHRFASASELRLAVLRMGGELLERVNLRRARRNEGEQVTRMEGVPERHQPQPDIVATIDASHFNLREEPRPQVIQAIKEEKENGKDGLLRLS
jgi:hypothetical protein